jgi:hypothetical protein
MRFSRSPERKGLFFVAQKIFKWVIFPFLYLDYLLSKSKHIYTFSGLDYVDEKVLIYVKHGKLDKYDFAVLDFFSKENFFTILCSTTAEDCGFADHWLKKKKFGRDSSFLRDFARSLKSYSGDNLEFLFLNDSMIWDTAALPEMVRRLRKNMVNTIMFPTESINPKTHFQHYLIHVKLDQNGIQKFHSSFDWVKTLHFKRSLVLFIEYKIQKKLSSKGWKTDTIVKYRELFNSAEEAISQKRFNPTQHLWDRLPNRGIVGVKRSLIFSNPVGVPNSPMSPEEALLVIRKIQASGTS